MKIDNLEYAVAKQADEIRDFEKLGSFLAFCGHGNLHNLSISNLMAVYSQNPDAVLVGSFEQWKKRGRYPLKGTGIAVYPGNTSLSLNRFCDYLFDIGSTKGDTVLV